MSINELTDEQLGALLRQQLQTTQTANNDEVEAHDEQQLPLAILRDLETTSGTTAQSNINTFINDLPMYTGGKWTQSGSLNKVLHNQVKQHKMDAVSVITHKYRDADRLRAAGRAATAAFEQLENILDRGGDEENDENDLRRVLENLRRLAVFGYRSGKHIDNDAKSISNRALGLWGPEDGLETKDMAYTKEEIEEWEEKRFRQSILRANASRSNFRGGRGNFNNKRGGNRNKFFFGKKNNYRHRHNDQPTPEKPRD